MAISGGRVLVFIVLVSGLSFVHCSQEACEAFGDFIPDRFEVIFENFKLEESDCGEEVQLEKFTTSAPTVKYSNAESDKKYLIAMVDPDAPSRDNPQYRSWRHWIVGNIKGDDLKKGDTDNSGETFTEYKPPTPPQGSGPHRYYLFVYEQEEPLGSKAEVGNDNRGGFSIENYAEENGLKAVAMNMFKTENK